MIDFSQTCEIDLDVLATVSGGKGAAKPTTPATPAQPSLDSVGKDALSGCLTGAGGSLGKAKSGQDVALGCALGAGKSVFEGLGKLFGGGKPAAK